MNIALLLSGGTGLRLGADIPKQYIEAGGKPIISYCIESLSVHEGIDGIQIVADRQWHDAIRGWIADVDMKGKFRGFSQPGENRQLSIFNGLESIRTYAADEDVVFVHDAARPLLSQQMITDCLGAIEGYDGVIPVLPMKDTVYESRDGRTISRLLERSRIYAGQAPELFRIGRYYEANKRLLPERILMINGSTEPAVMAGMRMAMIAGDENNFKITTKADLERFRSIIKTNSKDKERRIEKAE